MRKTIKLIAALTIIGTAFTSCTQEEAPIPQIQLTIWDTLAGTYKVDVYSSLYPADSSIARFRDTITLESNPFIYEVFGDPFYLTSGLVEEFKFTRTDSTLKFVHKNSASLTFVYHVQEETITTTGNISRERRTTICKKLKQ